MHASLAWLMLVIPLLMTMGCSTVLPKQKPPTIQMPAMFRNVASFSRQQPKTALTHGAWWKQYGSAELNGLVDRALANNSDLRIANLQIAQTKIKADQARAGTLPSLTAPMRVVVQRSSGESSDTQQSSQIGLQGTYRVDVWGEQQATVESADLQVWRTIYVRDDVQRNVIANLVATYIAWLMAEDSVTLARENEAVAKDILQTVEKRVALGDATRDEFEQQLSVLALEQAAVASAENQQDDIKTALARLVGSLNTDIHLVEKGVDTLVSPNIELGIPSSLVFQRPDIRMMEAKMHAANANIDLARARLLPPIDISAQAGFSGLAVAQLLQAQNLVLSAATSLVATIFDGGRREGEKAFAQVYYEEMVETYRQTIVQAVREVESALAALYAANLRQDAQKRSTRSSLSRYKIAMDSYGLGAVDINTMLDARRRFQRSQEDGLRAKADVLRSYVGLSHALGASGDAPTYTGNSRYLVAWESGEIQGTDAEKDWTSGKWMVQLPGIVHRGSVLPTARDLRVRWPEFMKGRILVAERNGSMAIANDSVEAWYRIAAVGWAKKEGADQFCSKLNERHQSCKVVRISQHFADGS